MSNKRFGGQNLGDIARRAQVEGTPTVPATPVPEPRVPIGELALRGGSAPQAERITLVRADPKRCRPWRFHDRHPSWYTAARCSDLLESLPTDGQRAPALARRLQGDPDYDFELIYGMRRRFACEALGLPLKVEITDADDQTAAVLMHLENADREDITPMERALSIAKQLKEGLFRTHEEMAKAKNISGGMMTQYIRAAELMEVEAIAKLLPDPTEVPVTWAYKVATRLADSACRDVIIAAAKHLGRKVDAVPQKASAILKLLYGAPDRSTRTTTVRKSYNVGTAGQMLVHRNPKGKVTLAFPKGWTAEGEEDVIAAVRSALKELVASS